jgi:hypothetical protein
MSIEQEQKDVYKRNPRDFHGGLEKGIKAEGIICDTISLVAPDKYIVQRANNSLDKNQGIDIFLYDIKKNKAIPCGITSIWKTPLDDPNCIWFRIGASQQGSKVHTIFNKDYEHLMIYHDLQKKIYSFAMPRLRKAVRALFPVLDTIEIEKWYLLPSQYPDMFVKDNGIDYDKMKIIAFQQRKIYVREKYFQVYITFNDLQNNSCKGTELDVPIGIMNKYTIESEK